MRLERRTAALMRRALLSLLLLACTPAPDPQPPAAPPLEIEPVPVVPPPAPTVEPPAAAAEPAPPQRLPGPLVVSPREAGDGILPDRPRARIDPEVGSMMDSIELFGWTSDSQRFEHCYPSGGRGGYYCESHGVDGSKDLFDDTGATEDVDAKKHRAIRARMRPLVRDASTWAWGGLVEIVWRDRQGDEGRPGIVEVGVRLKGSKAKAFPVRLQLDEFASGHLELVIPSPDGEYLGFVAHGFAGEFSDAFTTRIVAVDTLAAEACVAAGLAALRAP